jgi:hypothetical protein
MNKVASSLCSLGLFALAAGSAPNVALAESHNYDGYPCIVDMFAPDSWWGKHGATSIMLFSQPFCQGSYVGYGTALSAENTIWCPDETEIPGEYTDAQLTSLFEKAVDAAERGIRVQINSTDCGHMLRFWFYGR